MLYQVQAVVGAQIEDFIKYPPRQKPASFNLDTVMDNLKAAHAAAVTGAQGRGPQPPISKAQSAKEQPERALAS